MMKKVINRSVQLEQVTGADGKPLTWSMADYVGNVLNQAPQGGFSLDAIEKRLAIKKAFEQAKDAPDTILTNEQYSELTEAQNTMRWAVMEPGFLKFAAEVKAATDYNPNTVKRSGAA